VAAWAGGATLDTVLRETEIAPGDFVRNIRQLIDLVRQLAQVATDPGTREAAHLAIALLRRGVVGADDPAAPGSAPPPPVRS
jgi:ATP-dependent RNA helicase HelY